MLRHLKQIIGCVPDEKASFYRDMKVARHSIIAQISDGMQRMLRYLFCPLAAHEPIVLQKHGDVRDFLVDWMLSDVENGEGMREHRLRAAHVPGRAGAVGCCGTCAGGEPE